MPLKTTEKLLKKPDLTSTDLLLNYKTSKETSMMTSTETDKKPPLSLNNSATTEEISMTSTTN